MPFISIPGMWSAAKGTSVSSGPNVWRTQPLPMKALVLEKKGKLNLREFPMEETLGRRDARIAIKTVGICGSDVHYYTHGAIGDRVCMEPKIPNPRSKASRLGIYNLDPDVRFWATPPVRECLRPEGVHPADFTYKLPDIALTPFRLPISASPLLSTASIGAWGTHMLTHSSSQPTLSKSWISYIALYAPKAEKRAPQFCVNNSLPFHAQVEKAGRLH